MVSRFNLRLDNVYGVIPSPDSVVGEESNGRDPWLRPIGAHGDPSELMATLRQAQGERLYYARGEPFDKLRTGLSNHEGTLR